LHHLLETLSAVLLRAAALQYPFGLKRALNNTG
jgi:hypothetical protein